MNEECKIARERYWSESDDQEKIKRLHSVVKRLQSEVAMLNKFMVYLNSHSHAPDGSVLIPLFMRDEPHLNYCLPPRNEKLNEDEVYF